MPRPIADPPRRHRLRRWAIAVALLIATPARADATLPAPPPSSAEVKWAARCLARFNRAFVRLGDARRYFIAPHFTDAAGKTVSRARDAAGVEVNGCADDPDRNCPLFASVRRARGPNKEEPWSFDGLPDLRYARGREGRFAKGDRVLPSVVVGRFLDLFIPALDDCLDRL